LKRLPVDDSFDLHAFHPREAVAAAGDYLDAAREKGFTEVRLIHGKGTGARRAEIRRMLAARSDVEEFSDATPDRGSYGATLVRFRQRAEKTTGSGLDFSDSNADLSGAPLVSNPKNPRR
jgi:DNA-nicking Smr family endonuclease